MEGSATNRYEVGELRGSGPSRDDEELASKPSVFEGQVSRRSLLSKAAAAGVAALAGGVLLNPREATAHHADENGFLVVHYLNTHSISSRQTNTSGELAAEWEAQPFIESAIQALNNSVKSPAVRAINQDRNGIGVRGTGGFSGVLGKHRGDAGYGVIGESSGEGAGVWGRSDSGPGDGVLGRSARATGVRGEGVIGVWGVSSTTGQAGVYAEHYPYTDGPGLVADGKGESYAGVLGRNNGPGVEGVGGPGVWGRATKEGKLAVLGDRGISGTRGGGVMGVGVGDGFGNAGVHGRNWDEGGIGVIGDGGPRAGGVFGRNSFESGSGVVGQAENGYGGRFAGGKAQLMLTPGGTAGKPTTGDHTRGEIYMDSAGALFVCTTSGTPGTWTKVTTTPAPPV